jgi:hypothetical protein
MLNFIPMDTSGVAVGVSYQYVLSVDLVGPPAPTGLADMVGNELLDVTWLPNEDSDTIGYNLFINPIPGTQSAPLAADASGPGNVCTGGTVPSNRLGGAPTVLGEAADTYRVTGLTNGVDYAVAVAAVDAFGNTGPVTEPLCNTPSGSHQGSGGGCSVPALVGTEGSNGPLVILGMGATIAAGALARRRAGRTPRLKTA